MLRTVPLLALALVFAAVGCSDDDANVGAIDGEPGGQVIRVAIEDSGWSVATAGGQVETGDVTIEITNSRETDVDISVFPAPTGYEPGAPPSDDTQPVVEASLAGGQNIEVTATVADPGEYAVLVDPPGAGSAQGAEQGFTVVYG